VKHFSFCCFDIVVCCMKVDYTTDNGSSYDLFYDVNDILPAAETLYLLDFLLLALISLNKLIHNKVFT